MSKPLSKKERQDKNKVKKKPLQKEVREIKEDFRKERDTSEYVKQTFELNIRERNDYNQKQLEILEAIEDENVNLLVINGVWGCSKTFLSVLGALRLLNSGRCDKIVYCRNPVESSSTCEIGILPGSITERLAPYNAPFEDKVRELLPAKEANDLLKSSAIEFTPPGFIRGKSYSRTCLIIDEVSNLSYADFLLVVSRLGPGSIAIFVGDSYQNDIRNSGFKKFFLAFDNQKSYDNGVRLFEMRDPSDIVRSGFVRFCMEQLGVIKFDDNSNDDQRDCEAPRDFMAGGVEEGNLIEKITQEAEEKKSFIEKLKFW